MFFKLKKKQEKEEKNKIESFSTPVECHHKWRDFDWYVNFHYQRYISSPYGNVKIEIIEPYVCCLCGKRENKVLMRWYDDKIEEKNARVQLNKILDEYKDNLKPRLKIEDEISDMQHHVDREYLQLLEKLYPYKVGK